MPRGKAYTPPYQITARVLQQVSDIAEHMGRWQATQTPALSPRLRRTQRIRTLHATLAIEANSLSVEQITALLDGKRVIAPPRDVQEARNAIKAYEQLPQWQPKNESHLLAAHRLLMLGLVDHPGAYRRSGVGIYRDEQLLHMAPPASRVPRLMADLLGWLRRGDAHPLIASCVFHYEFEFIHPFADGNGRMGRLWQTLILSQWQPMLAWLPVETLVRERQSHYYAALGAANAASEATPFIHFMLDALLDALKAPPNSDPDSDPVSDPVAALLKKFKDDEPLCISTLMQRLRLKHRPSFRSRYLGPALKAGLIEMSKPETPNSPAQAYRLTARGQQVRQRGKA